jgi:cell division protein FtsB
MARIITFPAIPGVKDFTTLLAFLADKDAYDARLKSLKDMEESIKAEVALAGKVEEIDTFHAQAVQARDEAKKILDAAHIEAL